VYSKWHQINSVEKICGTKHKQKKLFDPDSSGEFFFCSGVEKIFRNLFASLDSLLLSYQEESKED